MLVQIVPGRGAPAAGVRSFIFDANLYAQEVLLDPQKRQIVDMGGDPMEERGGGHAGRERSRGILHDATGAVNVVADKLEPLAMGEWLSRGSRDFR